MVRAYGRVGDVERYLMPIMTARRAGEELLSRFVAVWEPYRDEPWLTDVRLLLDDDQGLALAATAGGDESMVFWGASDGSSIKAEGIEFTGRHACVRRRGGRVSAHLCEASRIAFDGHEVTATAQETYEITSASVDEQGEYMNVQDARAHHAAGQWAILLHPGGETRALRLGKAERQDMGVKLYCPDGLGIKGDARECAWEETYFPRRKFKGPFRLKVPTRLVRHLEGQ